MDAVRVPLTNADETVVRLPGNLAEWDVQKWLSDLDARLAEVQTGSAARL